MPRNERVEGLRELVDGHVKPAAHKAVRPFCKVCGWRKGGNDSWDGRACKCGLTADPIEPAGRTPSLRWSKATTAHRNAIPGVDVQRGEWLGVINGNRVCAVVIKRGRQWQAFVSRHSAHSYQGTRTTLADAKFTANIIARTADPTGPTSQQPQEDKTTNPSRSI